MQAAEELRQSFARRLSRASSVSSETTTSTRSAARYLRSSKRIFSTGLIATATTPLAARKLPDGERARQAAIELWSTAGPPDHLSNSLICREVAEWLKKNGQAADISDVTILRAVGRK